MSCKEDLISSIATYQAQIEQIAVALETATSDQKCSLQSVQNDLIDLLELTVQKLEASNNDTNKVKLSESPVESALEKELALFKAEISEITQESPTGDPKSSQSSDNTELEDVMKSLQELEGQEVRAPYTEQWGGYSYHDAVVLSVVTDAMGQANLENPQVLVLFSQPTSDAMLPCSHYMKGTCNFGDDCKYSHGWPVSIGDLQNYEQHDPKLLKMGDTALAKHQGQLWHRGTISDTLEDCSSFSFSCDTCNKTVEVDPHAIRLISKKEEQPKSINPDVTEDELESSFIPHDLVPQNPTFGAWEKHTNGIGSKLMKMMGYKSGDGLGTNGEGRVDPVTTLVYPKGVSLDRCMELRLAGNGQNLLEVEKHLEKEQKRELAKQKRQSESIRRKEAMFDLINGKLPNSGESSGAPKSKMDVSRNQLQKDATKELNMKNLALSKHIQSLKGEIAKLKSSRQRNIGDPTTVGIIDDKIKLKTKELDSLEQAEKKIQNEQQNRKDKKKMCLF